MKRSRSGRIARQQPYGVHCVVNGIRHIPFTLFVKQFWAVYANSKTRFYNQPFYFLSRVAQHTKEIALAAAYMMLPTTDNSDFERNHSATRGQCLIRIRFFADNSILGTGWGHSFAADDAEPSHHFAQESPQPGNLINLVANAYNLCHCEE